MEAYEQLYEESTPYVMSKCYQMGAGYADAQDITQEVMIKIYEHIQKLREPLCYHSWLAKIVTNTFNNYYRRNSRYVSLPEELDVKEVREYMLPDTCVSVLEQQRRIKEAIDPLKEKLQEVLILFYLKEMSEREIAETIQRPLGTVKSRLYCARAKMRNEQLYT